MSSERNIRWIAMAAIAFGALTIVSGGRALFGDAGARAQLGNIVPFVLWFNFLAGFFYLVAGAGMWLRRRWSVQLARLIAGATLIVFVAFGAHVAAGGAFEIRTTVAMTLRLLFWIAVAMAAARLIRLRA
jgi:hypothetical protein